MGDGIHLDGYEVDQIITQIVVQHLSQPVIDQAMEYARTALQTDSMKDQIRNIALSEVHHQMENYKINEQVKALIRNQIDQALTAFKANPENMREFSQQAQERLTGLLVHGLEDMQIDITIRDRIMKVAPTNDETG